MNTQGYGLADGRRALPGRLATTLTASIGTAIRAYSRPDRHSSGADRREECVQEAFVKAFKAWRGGVRMLRRKHGSSGSPSTRRAPMPPRKFRSIGETVRRLGARRKASRSTRPTPPTARCRVPASDCAGGRDRPPLRHGYSNRQIAASLGVAESTIASRLAAAKARLRDDGKSVGPILERGRNSGDPGVTLGMNVDNNFDQWLHDELGFE